MRLSVHDLRSWTDDVHRTVDDTPYGGGPGMVMLPEPWLMFACGRYEGIDARVAEYAATRMTVDEISLGDYVLCGGEVAVLAIMEAVARLIPGVLGNALSAEQDSFTDAVGGLLEAPAYTKPAVWRGRPVPEVLLSGHHARIEEWRAEQSRQRSAERRPDLL